MPAKETIFDSVILYPTQTKTPIAAGDFKVAKVGMRLRTLNAATYVAIGGLGAVEFRLTVVDNYFEIPANLCGYVNLAHVFIVSDSDDAELEVWWVQADI